MHICEIAPRREAPEILPWKFAPFEEERARGMPGARCTRSLMRAIGVVKYAHEYSQRKHRIHPASPTQWFTDYTRSSRGPLVVLTPSVVGAAPRSPVGLRAISANLDADHGAPEPHDFSVRDTAARLARRDRSRVASPCDHLRTRPCRVHRIPHSTFVTIAIRPLSMRRDGWREP